MPQSPSSIITTESKVKYMYDQVPIENGIFDW